MAPARRLLGYEIRALAWVAFAVTAAYGALILVGGTVGTVECAVEDCGVGPWYPPALALATAVASAAAARAGTALWRTARALAAPSRAGRRFAVAWLAALPWGVLLGGYFAFGQVLYSAMAVPVMVALLALVRIFAGRRRRASG